MSTAEDVAGSARDVAGTTRKEAGAVAQRASQQAGEVTGAAKEQVSALTQEARRHAGDLVSQASDQLRSQAEDQAARAGESLQDIGSQLRALTGEGGPQEGPVLDLVRSAADRVDDVSRRLDEGGLDGLVDDLQRFARRRPGVFLLGAAVSGFAVGRLLRNVDTSALTSAASGGGGTSDPMASGQGSRAVSARTSPQPVTERPLVAGVDAVDSAWPA